MLAVALLNTAVATPSRPSNDDETVEVLRSRPLDQSDRRLRVLRALWRVRPDDATVAIELARQAELLSKRDGDPRLLGLAEAALEPWWRLPAPPLVVRIEKANILQSNHDFGGAMTELDAVLKEEPEMAQALLTRAAILQVTGHFDAAAKDCRVVLAPDVDPMPTSAPYGAGCLADLGDLQGLPGSGVANFDGPLDLLKRSNQPTGWLLLLKGESALRHGSRAVGLDALQQAEAANPDAFSKAALADALLDDGRPTEVIALLKDDGRSDPLMLRLALAFAAAKDPRAEPARLDLAARFAAAHLRGDVVHRREEAIFELRLNHRPDVALTLAMQNWAVQKEGLDARILLEAALAAHKTAAASDVLGFLQEHGIHDLRLAPYQAALSGRAA